MTASAPLPQIFHATTVAVEGRGVAILGASGSGKSALALQLIALGAQLVADDRTIMATTGNSLTARAPDTIAGRIEARGVGLLTLPFVPEIKVYLAVDMDQAEENRLPHPHHRTLLGQTIPCLYRIDAPHFAAALFLILKTMKPLPDD